MAAIAHQFIVRQQARFGPRWNLTTPQPPPLSLNRKSPWHPKIPCPAVSRSGPLQMQSLGNPSQRNPAQQATQNRFARPDHAVAGARIARTNASYNSRSHSICNLQAPASPIHDLSSLEHAVKCFTPTRTLRRKAFSRSALLSSNFFS